MMHILRKLSGLALALLLLVGVSACGMGSSRSEGPTTTLRVENELIPSTSLRIYAVSANGGRTLVGSVSPGASTSLRFNTINRAGGEYQFVAEIPLGNPIISNPVSMGPGDTVLWNVRSNLATVQATQN
jgi:hypothetical protein